MLASGHHGQHATITRAMEAGTYASRDFRLLLFAISLNFDYQYSYALKTSEI